MVTGRFTNTPVPDYAHLPAADRPVKREGFRDGVLAERARFQAWVDRQASFTLDADTQLPRRNRAADKTPVTP